MFQGYSDETFEFFMAIRFNNNADFFHSNRDWYLRGVREPSLALAEALNDGCLGGAALDVMVPEPLPADDPLWSARNILITPHVSGNMTMGYTRDEAVRLFCEDLENYAAGRPLARLVDRAAGY